MKKRWKKIIVILMTCLLTFSAVPVIGLADKASSSDAAVAEKTAYGEEKSSDYVLSDDENLGLYLRLWTLWLRWNSNLQNAIY